jgi:hypothetical protein
MGIFLLMLMLHTQPEVTSLTSADAYIKAGIQSEPFTSSGRIYFLRALYQYRQPGDYRTVAGQGTVRFSGVDSHEEIDLHDIRIQLAGPPRVHFMTIDNDGDNHLHVVLAGNLPLMTDDPNENFSIFALYSLSAMAAVYVHNIAGSSIRGHSFRKGFSNANKTITRQNDLFKLSVFQNDETEIYIGINPFFLTASASINHFRHDFILTQGIGVGPDGLFISGQGVYSPGDWEITAGYSGGANFIGYGLDSGFKGYGAGYYRTIYGREIGIDGNPNPQIKGGIRLTTQDISLRIENDMFGDGKDRWRTSAAELEAGYFLIGTNIYTNAPDPGTELDPVYESRFFKRKREGTYSDGKVYSSPVYIGFRHEEHVLRLGADHPFVQDVTQNFIHKYFSKSPYFTTPYGDYFLPYIKTGFYNRYSLFQ